jgi:hypothetical protein
MLCLALTRMVDGDHHGWRGRARDKLADAPLEAVPAQRPGLVQAFFGVYNNPMVVRRRRRRTWG